MEYPCSFRGLGFLVFQRWTLDNLEFPHFSPALVLQHEYYHRLASLSPGQAGAVLPGILGDLGLGVCTLW